VPDALVHQWFVELLRRFNLHFSIYDEERCVAATPADEPEANPFAAAQLVLCPLSLLADNPQRARQAAAADWDLLIVDEAHRLSWSTAASSPEYDTVDTLCQAIPAVLLLTATPEQLGADAHFARLRLLDPERYPDLSAFQAANAQFQTVARIAGALLDGEMPTAEDLAVFATESAAAALAARIEQGAGDTDQLISELLDRHGVGRVMFRNVRAAVGGFPQRRPEIVRLPCPSDAVRQRLAAEFAADTTSTTGPDIGADDPRIRWLADLLTTHADEKFLLICRTRQRAESAAEALRAQLNVPLALFHEALQLVQRDRNAAWFAEADGARILFCSEIGSEGRNFQFAHHLVLLDLPLAPDLLEQRIGRLDRIGQSKDIHVHVPVVVGTPQAVLARWYDDGLDGLAHSVAAGGRCARRFMPELIALASAPVDDQSTAALERLISDTRDTARAESARLAAGRDRLLELGSCRPEAAATLVQQIADADSDRRLADYIPALMEHLGVQLDEIDLHSYLLRLGNLFTGELPMLTDGMRVTLSREKALHREDMVFLSWDHPLVGAAMDTVISGTTGNAAFAVWPDASRRRMLLETVYVVDCPAPPALGITRFLTPAPVRVVIDHQLQDCTANCNSTELEDALEPGRPGMLYDKPELTQTLLPAMLAAAEKIAAAQVPEAAAAARAAADQLFTAESKRLRDLQRCNPAVRDAEISAWDEAHSQIASHLDATRLRLDSVRLIWQGPSDGF
jgi:ATP-dependent helicase HepA